MTQLVIVGDAGSTFIPDEVLARTPLADLAALDEAVGDYVADHPELRVQVTQDLMRRGIVVCWRTIREDR